MKWKHDSLRHYLLESLEVCRAWEFVNKWCTCYIICGFAVLHVCIIGVLLVWVKVDYYCTQYQPSPPTCSAAGVVSVGRSTLLRKRLPLPSLHRQPTSQFAFTRPATALLERVAVAIGNNEPLLLVGETGTGKTSAVQYLAELMCKHLPLMLYHFVTSIKEVMFSPLSVCPSICPLAGWCEKFLWEEQFYFGGWSYSKWPTRSCFGFLMHNISSGE